MLTKEDLASQFEASITENMYEGVKQGLINKLPIETDKGTQDAEEFAKTLVKILSKPLAEAMATAINAYINSITITGTIITFGNKFTQTAKLIPKPTPMATAHEMLNIQLA